ncbi:hypothetical protein GH714_004141 [Hevea brasiliensis]|uniref:NB-ARC domain-containing protein n=1 Tax=Hevea brasiliensis TaxID=3981 RepID=A0A6A6L0H1_HEVBR|nr:hypothetical protein GH714_004141 [Hevea brasiliensis]
MWLSDLRDLAYDLEDIVDELDTKVQRCMLEPKLVRSNKVQKFFSVIHDGLNLDTVKFNSKMVYKIEKASARLDAIIKQKDDLRLGESMGRRVSLVRERPPSTSLVNEAKIYGREEDKKAMLKLLDAEASDAEVSVIPITGMGGVGKTTLAQLIYNDPALDFDLKFWVSIGEDFDVFRITKTIFLQLDDPGAPKSRIIVTTRSQEVSLMMGTTPAYPLKELSYNECLYVFAQHALGTRSFDEHFELKEMGEEIVKMWRITFGSKSSWRALKRALSLTSYDFQVLPDSIGALKHLRYLDLSYTPIKRLPNSVDKLFNLQTLMLRHCVELIELPRGICNLLNLRYLDITGTSSLQEMPPHIGNLTGLCMLPKFIVGKCNRRITELKKLSNLQGQLHITSLENVVDIGDADSANLKHKLGVTELVLQWTNEFSSVFRNSSDEEQVLNSLRPHQSLSSLSIRSFGGRQFPLWLGDASFTSMVQVELSTCPQITLLPPLGRLHLLKRLTIERLTAVKEVGVEFYVDDSCFPCLETIEISYMDHWELWSWSNGLGEDSVAKFPKLREFRIRYCPKLVGKLPTSLPSLEELSIFGCPRLVDLPKGLPSLKELHVLNCPQLVDLPEGLQSLITLSIIGSQEAVLRNVSYATSLTTLEIAGMSGLVRLDEAKIKTLGALQVLEIRNCGELRYLWADETNSDYLTSLKDLKIHQCNQLVSLVNGEEGLLPCNLESLNISQCRYLEELPSGLSNLKSLQYLSIHSCASLVSFPARGLPDSLITVNIEICRSLAFLPEGIIGGKMSHLEELYYIGCPPSLRFSPNGRLPDSLKILAVDYWTTQSLNSLYYGLSHLTQLRIDNCLELESFPERELPIPTLISLKISYCGRLRSLTNHMQDLQCLQSLQICCCDQFELFPEMGLPNPKLVSLKIMFCENLRSLPSQMQNLTSLRYLEISNCRVSFPEGCLPPNLAEHSYV